VAYVVVHLFHGLASETGLGREGKCPRAAGSHVENLHLITCRDPSTRGRRRHHLGGLLGDVRREELLDRLAEHALQGAPGLRSGARALARCEATQVPLGDGSTQLDELGDDLGVGLVPALDQVRQHRLRRVPPRHRSSRSRQVRRCLD
jgi:hypothetical protein